MQITNPEIDKGKAFDWGRTSELYAKFRDIYPEIFYQKIIARNIGLKHQKILDLGTGTGVLPRNLYAYGAEWTGIDISENQIIQAKKLAEQQNMQITFQACSAEQANFPENYFDAVTACQCFWYFNHEILTPILSKILKQNGKILILYMAWLPLEDTIAKASEELVLQYNPDWTGAGEIRKQIAIPEAILSEFKLISHEEFDVKIPFTRDSWHGRMQACRGVGASLSEHALAEWQQEHKNLLEKIAPENFEILHYIAIAELIKK